MSALRPSVCSEFAEVLPEYLGGGASESLRAGCEAHLAACHACAAYLATYQEAMRMARLAWEPAGGADGEEADPAAPEPLVRSIVEARGKA